VCCAKEPIFRPAKLRILARAVTNFANRLGFDCLAPRCRPTKVKKKERFGQPIMGAKYYCSCHEYAFRSLRKCEPNLLRRRRRSERRRPPGNQRGDRSQASQSNWPRCKRSAISFEKPKPAKACTDRLTRRPVQYENRRSACPFLTERLASAVVGLAPPKFLRGGRDFGILEKLSDMVGAISMARFACCVYRNSVVSVEAQALSSRQSTLPQAQRKFFREAPKVRRWTLSSKCFVSR